MQIDHIVIRVGDLAQAGEDYRALGFTVMPGGEHPGMGSRNALIPFADGSYLELIAYRSGTCPAPVPREERSKALRREGRTPVERRVLPWETSADGLVDWALLPVEMEVELEAARRRGLSMEGPYPGSRVRPDGQVVSWQFGMPDGYDLPFLCADVTPRSLRVPAEGKAHPNGAEGIAAVVTAVRDPALSRRRFAQLIGASEGDGPFQARRTRIEYRAADKERLRTHGEGPVALDLLCASGSHETLARALTHGAAIRLTSE